MRVYIKSKNELGYCLENKNIHVCGFEKGKIIFQEVSKSIKVRKRKIMIDSKQRLYFSI